VPAAASSGSQVHFSATSAIGGCTSNPAFIWDFGDGRSASGIQVTHAYGSEGSFTWRLTVVSTSSQCETEGVILVRSKEVDHRRSGIRRPG
jgi:PKD repeat protein